MSGEPSAVSVRHAVDFTHFIDGNRRITSSLRSSIGTRFDDDPRHSDEAPSAVSIECPQSSNDLEAILSSINAAESVETSDPSRHNLVPQVASSSPSYSSDNHGKILAAIADDPRLVRFYLDFCQSVSSKRTTPSDDPRRAQRQRVQAQSDLLSFTSSGTRSSKHAFAPTQTQLQIHGMLTSPDHEGKEPSSLVDSMISSRSTKFQPHPAIITRTYDFQFGARGLSGLHFKRFDFAARRAWYADGSVNLNNFSASVAMPKAGKAETIDDVANALTVLHLFAEEFFETHTCRLISGAREFMEELRGYCRWSAQDVGTIMFWLDRVFEDYRAATDVDARHGSATRTMLRDRLSLQDPDLQSALYIIQSERVAALRNPATPQVRESFQVRHEGHRRQDSQRNGRKTPDEVIEALPRKGRLTVCMKYLSAAGCVSKSDERCAFPNHAHFLPADLSPVVRNHINKHLGGLRAEFRQ